MQRHWFMGAALAALLAAGPVMAQDSVPGTPNDGVPGAVATAPAEIEMAQAMDLFASGNYAEGMSHLLKAADGGNLSAQVMLGMLYLHGSTLYNLGVVPADPEAARSWLTRAAAAGSGIAKYMLAELDLFGPARGPQLTIVPLRKPMIE
jgi:TPR repeat protein